MNYTKPKVTIDLEEYEYLKREIQRLESELNNRMTYSCTPAEPAKLRVFGADLSFIKFPYRVYKIEIMNHIISLKPDKLSLCELVQIINGYSLVHLTIGCNQSLQYTGYTSIDFFINGMRIDFKP